MNSHKNNASRSHENPYASPQSRPFDRDACFQCRTKLEQQQTRCPACSAIQRSHAYRKKSAASTLAFNFGGFGLHHFYLGKPRAWLYLAFCWTLWPFVLGWIEGFIFLRMDPARWDEKYNEGWPKVNSEKTGFVFTLYILAGFVLGALAIFLAIFALPKII